MVIKAEREHLAQAAGLACELWPDATPDGLLAEWKALAPEEGTVFLAVEDGAPAGFAQCRLRHDYVEGTDSSPVGYLEGIYVREPYRGQGAARALLRACENWAAEQGCVEFASDCELDNGGSIAFHLGAGFTEANRIVCFTKKLRGKEQVRAMDITICELTALSVIGMEGKAEPGHNPAPALWEAANARFGEVEGLALRDENGFPVGVWGAMSDVSRQFLPWEDGFSRGLYLAGIQVPSGAEPPEGWTKWTLPAFACLRVRAEGDYAAAFRAGLDELARRGLSLAGAVQECQRMAEGGQLYLFFPFKRL